MMRGKKYYATLGLVGALSFAGMGAVGLHSSSMTNNIPALTEYDSLRTRLCTGNISSAIDLSRQDPQYWTQLQRDNTRT